MELIAAFLPFLIILGVFWLFLIRPQQKQQKEHQQMINNLKVGDQIITIGGIKGKIIKIKDNNIRLRISSNVDIDLVKSSVGHLDKAEQEEKDKE